jgi:hypothetical protein
MEIIAAKLKSLSELFKLVAMNLTAVQVKSSVEKY